MRISTYDDLYPLLEALCEDRLDESGAAQLEQRVLGDEGARRLYVDYLSLHGLLYWDAVSGTVLSHSPAWPAIDASGEPSPPALVSLAVRPPVSHSRRHTRAAGIFAAAVCVLAAALVWKYAPRGAQPRLADQPAAGAQPGPSGHPETVDDFEAPAVVPIQLPPEQPGTGERLAASVVVAPGGDDGLPADTEVVAFIDERLEQRWKESDVTPSPRADDAEWLRRVYLDLAGHVPDVAAVEAFLADHSPEKRPQMVNRLLAEPEFASRLSTVWTNLLVGRAPRGIDREALAKFLREQFWRNRPWTETVTELVAAEGSEHENGAANFLLAHLNNQAVPATAITARIFLCEQVQCSQCHIHPVVKGWGQEQFWELNAFFHQTEVVERTVTTPDGRSTIDRALVSRPVAGPSYYETLSGVMCVAYPKFDGTEISSEAQVDRRRELARLMSSGEHPQLADAFVNRMWALLLGRGFTWPLDDMGPHNPASHPEILRVLSQAFVRSGYDVRQLVRWIWSTRVYQLSSRFSEGNLADAPERGLPPLFSRMYVKPMSAEQLFDSLLAATNAERAGIGTWADAAARRGAWLAQFYSALDNEENADATTFDGSIPQALVMMNGELVREAVSDRPGTFLHDVLSAGASDAEKLRKLCLSSLSREPTPQELAVLHLAVRRSASRAENGGTPQRAVNEALADSYWAYLNAAEFMVNH